MDGWADFPCVLQDFVPFGAAALLPFNINQTLLKQGKGAADHLLPLGCYFFLGSGPEGDKVLQNTGHFRLFVRSSPPPSLSGLKSTL